LGARNLPLLASGESAATAPAQSGRGHLLNDRLGRHLFEGFVQRLVAVACDVLVDVLGIDLAGIGEHAPDLLAVERDRCLDNEARGVEQALDDLPTNDVLVDEFGNIRRLYPAVEGFERQELHDGPGFAKTLAAGLDEIDFAGKAALLELAEEGLVDARLVTGVTGEALAEEGRCHELGRIVLGEKAQVLAEFLALLVLVARNSFHAAQKEIRTRGSWAGLALVTATFEKATPAHLLC